MSKNLSTGISNFLFGNQSSKIKTKTVSIYNSTRDAGSAGSGRPLTANYYWYSKGIDTISGRETFIVFYKREFVSWLWQEEKAQRLVNRLNGKIKKAMQKGRPLPRPQLGQITYVGKRNKSEILFNEYIFELDQEKAGISRQFQELEIPGIHKSATELMLERRRNYRPLEITKEAEEKSQIILEAYKKKIVIEKR